MAVVDDAASLFRAADGGATLALLAKLTVETAQQCKMEEARNKLQVHIFPCSSLKCSHRLLRKANLPSVHTPLQDSTKLHCICADMCVCASQWCS